MALFPGEDLVDIIVGGRTVKLPASVASAMQLPQQQAAPQAPAPQQIAPGPAVEEQPGFNATGVQAPPPVPEQLSAPQGGSSEYPTYAPTIGATPSFAQEQAPAVAPQPDFKVEAPKPAAPAKPAKPAAPPTAQQKADGALNAQVGAINEQAAAGRDVSNIEAAGHAMIGQAYADRNAELDKLYAKRRDDAVADQAATDAKMSEYTTLKDKIANAKVDRSVNHPVLAAISLALGAIGQAMTKGDKNPALDVLWKTIDRRVEGQMADIEQMKAVAGMTKEEVANLREKASSKLAMHNMLIAGESDRAAKQIEEMVARTQSESVRASGTRIAAELREKAAIAVGNAAQAQLQHEQREKFQKQEMGYKYSALKQNQNQFDADMQFKREKEYLDYNRALAAERAKAGEAGMKAMMEMQKDNETRGIRNATDATALLTPKGRAMIAEADKLAQEAAALKSSTGPLTQQQAARAQLLEDKASAIRGEANVKEVLRHRDPTQAGRLSDKYTAAQTVTRLTDEIKLLYDRDGRSYVKTTAGQAALQAKQTELTMALKNAWQLGVLSKQDTNLINQGTGGDPTKGWEPGNLAHIIGVPAGTDPEAFKARLDSIAAGAQDNMLLDLNGIGYGGKREDLFQSKSAPTAPDDPINKAAATVQAGATTGEQVADEASKGGARRAVDRVVYDASTSNAERQKNIDNSGSVKYAGFTEKQGAAFDTILRAYKSGDEKSKARAEQRIIEQATSSRQDLSLSTMHALREHAPELYQKALAQLPETPSPGKERTITVPYGQVKVQDKAPEQSVRQQLAYEDEVRKRDTSMQTARGAASDTVIQSEPLLDLVKHAVVGDDASYSEIARRAAAGDPDAKKVLPNVLRQIGNQR